jgi:hypothetical protein
MGQECRGIPHAYRPTTATGQAEDQTESAEEKWYDAEVGRLISARNREDAEKYRNTMETMRRVAQEQHETRERIRESAREDGRQTAGASIQHLLQRMDRFEKHLSQLASRLHGIEELLRHGMTEQSKGRGNGIRSHLCEESGNGTYALMRRHSNYGFRLSYPHLALL